MAEVDDTTCCSICFEKYTENGAKIPPILPCHHTLCEGCAAELLAGGILQCPECRTRHHSPSGVRTFPQNKYILAVIRKGTGTKVEDLFEKCKKHGKEASLYCKEPTCQTVICQLCLIKHHKSHDVVDN